MLFGETGAIAGIRNLGLLNVDMTGGSHVAVLVGWNFASITDSYATGIVTGIGNKVGGLVGQNGNETDGAGNITDSYATGSMVSTGSNVRLLYFDLAKIFFYYSNLWLLRIAVYLT